MKLPFTRNRRLKNERPTSDICSKDGIQNAAQTLLANIRFSSVDEPMRVLAITSSIPNEGKTTVALALAMAIGNSGAKCLIVEGDMRRRSMRSLLGAHTRYGLHRLLTGKCTLDEAVVPTDFNNIYFLDAEQGIPNPDAILSSSQFKKLLKSLTKYYHYILLDTPPVSAFADASIIASRVDGVLLVTREGYTNKNEVVRASEQLRKSGANIIGIVLNGHQAKSGGTYGGYYYDYYYDYYNEEDSPTEGIQQAAAAGADLLKSVNPLKSKDNNKTSSPAKRSAHAASKQSSSSSQARQMDEKRESWRQEQEDEWEEQAPISQDKKPAHEGKHRIPSYEEIANANKNNTYAQAGSANKEGASSASKASPATTSEATGPASSEPRPAYSEVVQASSEPRPTRFEATNQASSAARPTRDDMDDQDSPDITRVARRLAEKVQSSIGENE